MILDGKKHISLINDVELVFENLRKYFLATNVKTVYVNKKETYLNTYKLPLSRMREGRNYGYIKREKYRKKR